MWWGGVFFFQAEDGIRDLVRSRGLGDVYKRQEIKMPTTSLNAVFTYSQYSSEAKTYSRIRLVFVGVTSNSIVATSYKLPVAKLDSCLLYTSDAADERSSVDLGGRRFIKKK